jgi:hypothetical protein
MNNQLYDMLAGQSRRDSVHSRISGGSIQGSPPRAATNLHPQQLQQMMMANPLQNGRQYSPQQLAEAQQPQQQRQHQEFMRQFAQMSPEEQQAVRLCREQLLRQRQQQAMAASPRQAQATGVNGLRYTPEQIEMHNRRVAMIAQMSPGQQSRQRVQQQQAAQMSPAQRQSSQQPPQQQQQPRPVTSASPPEIYFTHPINDQQYTRERFEQALQRAIPEQQAIWRKAAALQQQPRPATGASLAETYYTDANNRRYTRAEFDEGLKTMSSENQARFREEAEQQQQQARMAISLAHAQKQQQQPTPAASPADVWYTDGKGNQYTRDLFEQQLAKMSREEAEHYRQVAQSQRQQSKKIADPAQAQQQQPHPSTTTESAKVYATDANGRSYTEEQFEQHLSTLPQERAAAIRHKMQQQRQAKMAPDAAQAQTQAQAQAQAQPPQRLMSVTGSTEVFFTDGRGRNYTEAEFEQQLAQAPVEQAELFRQKAQHQREIRARLAQMSPEQREEFQRQARHNMQKFQTQTAQAKAMPSAMSPQAQAAAKTSRVTQPSPVLPQVAGTKRPSPESEDAYTEGRAPKVAMFAVPTPPARPSSAQGGAVAKQKKKKTVVKQKQVKDIERRHKNAVPIDQGVPAKPASTMGPPVIPASAMSPLIIPASAMPKTKAKANTSKTIDLTGTENDSQPKDRARSTTTTSPGSAKSSAIDLTGPEESHSISEGAQPSARTTVTMADIASIEREPVSGLLEHPRYLHALVNGVHIREVEYEDYNYNDIAHYSSEAAEIRMRRAILEAEAAGAVNTGPSSYMYDARYTRDLVGYGSHRPETERGVEEGEGNLGGQMSEEGAELVWQMMMVTS